MTSNSPCAATRCDGDHPSKPLETLHDDPIPAKGSKMISRVQSLKRNTLLHSNSELDHSPGNWPDFVWLVELSTEGGISCMYDPFKLRN